MYVRPNFKTKKALKEAIAEGKVVTVFQPGPFNSGTIKDGPVTLEGPHFPEPHKWYAKGVVQNGRLIKVS